MLLISGTVFIDYSHSILPVGSSAINRYGMVSYGMVVDPVRGQLNWEDSFSLSPFAPRFFFLIIIMLPLELCRCSYGIFLFNISCPADLARTGLATTSTA